MWSTVCHRLERFVDVINSRRDSDRRIKLAWISTYNAKCGIASYSESILKHIDANIFDVTIFADNLEPVGADPDNLVRVWARNKPSLRKLSRKLVAQKFDAVFFQFHFAFFDLTDLGFAIEKLSKSNVDVYVTFHRVKEVVQVNGEVRTIGDHVEALKRARMIFAQSMADLELLRGYGLTVNVALLAPGIVDQPIFSFSTVRALLGIAPEAKVIASSGFLLPGKGIPELVVAFRKITDEFSEARLLLVNADYGYGHSNSEIKRVQEIVQDLGLSDNVVMINDFLTFDQIHLLLSAANVIVYPYQGTDEPTSAAIRNGFSAGRPVACTPLPVFEDVSDGAFVLAGTHPEEMAESIISLLSDGVMLEDATARSRAWRTQHTWPSIVERLSNILIGQFQESKNVEVAVRDGAKCLDEIVENTADPQKKGPEIYRSLLGRPPGAAAYPRLRAAPSHNFVRGQIASIIESDEFADKVFSSPALLADLNVSVVDYEVLTSFDDEEFVDECFCKLLGRAPVECDREFYLEPLRTGTWSKEDMIEELIRSKEYRESCVPVYFV